MSTRILAYADRHRDNDEDCKRWWDLRKNFSIEKGVAKDWNFPEFLEIDEKLSKIILRNSKTKIVASTLNIASHKVLRDVGYEPALLIIDEAGQSIELDNVIAMSMSSLLGVVFTGDQRQLSPTVLSLFSNRNPYSRQLSTSLLDRLIKQGFPYCMLKTNYRMHPDISKFSNREF